MQLNGTGDRIDDADYPLTTDELLETLEHAELELQNGSEPIAEILDRTGAETYETAEDARLALYNCVSSKAIGRKGYSDRDPTTPGSQYGHEQLSF
jgi:hypothetical protein